jgi:hypothetical protein
MLLRIQTICNLCFRFIEIKYPTHKTYIKPFPKVPKSVTFRYSFWTNDSSPFDENQVIMTISQFAHQLFHPQRFSFYYAIVFLTSNFLNTLYFFVRRLKSVYNDCSTLRRLVTLEIFRTLALLRSCSTCISFVAKQRAYYNLCINYYIHTIFDIKIQSVRS